MHLATAILRALRLLLHLGSGACQALWLPRVDRMRQQRMLVRWSRQLLCILGIRLRVSGALPAAGGQLLVANHISWLDVFALNAVCPGHFVAKSEVRGWPFFGWLSARAGTLFISRDRHRPLQRLNREMTALLHDGARICLFPEGTSSSGETVGHFHAALFQPAITAGVPVLPVRLRYLDADGADDTTAAFTGDMTLLASIWRILCSDTLTVSVHLLSPLPPAPERRPLADAARQQIATCPNDTAWEHAPPPQALPQCSADSAYALLLAPGIAEPRP